MKTYNTTIDEVQLRLKRGEIQKTKIGASSDCEKLFRLMIEEETLEVQEHFIVLFLNRSNTTIGWMKLSTGGITGTVVDVRLIFSAALKTLATSIVLCHNHPSGNMTASNQDIDTTKKVRDAGKILDIHLIDHIILAPETGKYLSMADEGLI
jgi:DNA repair protein RadC